MKFYSTIEPCRKLKNLFSNLSSFYIIDVDTILKESGLNPEKSTHKYLINVELERLIVAGAKSKRYLGMIYINSKLNCDTIVAIKQSIDAITNSVVDSFVILDDYDTPKLTDYYSLFDEVVFFPALRKTKLIECVPRIIPKINNIINDKENKKLAEENLQEQEEAEAE
jgi:hypothetical protein